MAAASASLSAEGVSLNRGVLLTRWADARVDDDDRAADEDRRGDELAADAALSFLAGEALEKAEVMEEEGAVAAAGRPVRSPDSRNCDTRGTIGCSSRSLKLKFPALRRPLPILSSPRPCSLSSVFEKVLMLARDLVAREGSVEASRSVVEKEGVDFRMFTWRCWSFEGGGTPLRGEVVDWLLPRVADDNEVRVSSLAKCSDPRDPSSLLPMLERGEAGRKSGEVRKSSEVSAEGGLLRGDADDTRRGNDSGVVFSLLLLVAGSADCPRALWLCVLDLELGRTLGG